MGLYPVDPETWKITKLEKLQLKIINSVPYIDIYIHTHTHTHTCTYVYIHVYVYLGSISSLLPISLNNVDIFVYTFLHTSFRVTASILWYLVGIG